jgi:hypothetical protein
MKVTEFLKSSVKGGEIIIMYLSGYVVIADLVGIDYIDDQPSKIVICQRRFGHEPETLTFDVDFLEKNEVGFEVYPIRTGPVGNVRICNTATPRMSFEQARECVEKEYPIPPSKIYPAAMVVFVRVLVPDNIPKDVEAFIIGRNKIAVKVPGSPYGLGDWMIGEWSK